MRLRVSRAEKLDYARVLVLEMEGEGVSARLELPIKVLEEIGWHPSPGDEVEVEVEREPRSVDEWEVVMSGRLLKAGRGEITYTFGGLLFTLVDSSAEPLKKTYLMLRRLKK